MNSALAAAHRAALMQAMQGGVAVVCTGRELIRNRVSQMIAQIDKLNL